MGRLGARRQVTTRPAVTEDTVASMPLNVTVGARKHIEASAVDDDDGAATPLLGAARDLTNGSGWW
jgi:hypothetical protein